MGLRHSYAVWSHTSQCSPTRWAPRQCWQLRSQHPGPGIGGRCELPTSGNPFALNSTFAERIPLSIFASVRSTITPPPWICTSKSNLAFGKKTAAQLTGPNKQSPHGLGYRTSSRDWLESALQGSSTRARCEAPLPRMARSAHAMITPLGSINLERLQKLDTCTANRTRTWRHRAETSELLRVTESYHSMWRAVGEAKLNWPQYFTAEMQVMEKKEICQEKTNIVLKFFMLCIKNTV